MISLIKALCPFPTVWKDDGFFDGYLISQPRACKKCKAKDCWAYVSPPYQEDISHYICPKDYSLILCRWKEGELLCNGLLVHELNKKCTGIIRKQRQDQKISISDIKKWYEKMKMVGPLLEKKAETIVQESLLGLHDIKTAVGLVTRNAEAIIAAQSGTTDDDKIENAPPPLKSLLKSVKLLLSRLSMSSIVTNPDSVSHGRKRNTHIYKLFDRMVRLFLELAAQKNITIRMTGNSYSKFMCYDSFESIPLVLIDNAVKYSLQGSKVLVKVNDDDKKTVVSVSSYGPVVPEKMRDNIFKKGFRTPGASYQASSGSGLGLYIADMVAKAHGFEIHYKCMDIDETKGMGTNIFCFEINI